MIRRAHVSVPIYGSRPVINFSSEFHTAYEAGVSEENRQRYIVQSQQTKGGRAAPLPTISEAISYQSSGE